MATISTEVPADLSTLSDDEIHALWYKVCDDLAAARDDQKRVTQAIRDRDWEPGDPPPEPVGSGEQTIEGLPPAQVAEAVGVESEAAAFGQEG